MLNEFGQDFMLAAQETNGYGDKEKEALDNLARLSRNGLEKLMKDYKLDALVTPGSKIYHVLDIGGFPGINVPAGYDFEGIPFGITFGGLRFSDAKLIEIAYDFEKTTMIRKPPRFYVGNHDIGAEYSPTSPMTNDDLRQETLLTTFSGSVSSV